MNKVYRSIWNESLGAWVAASELTSARGKRSGRSATRGISTLVGTLLTGSLAMLSAPAMADFSEDGALGASCSRIGTGVSAATWTCQVPNGSGGFATVTGVPDDGSGVKPNYTILGNWVASNLHTNTIVLGNQNSAAVGTESIAIGHNAKASGKYSVAMGTEALAEGEDAIGIGRNARSAGYRSVAVGSDSLAAANWTTAFGNYAQALEDQGTALGTSTVANLRATAVGAEAQALGEASIAIGGAQFQSQAIKATGEASIVIGTSMATASGKDAVAVGTSAKAQANDALALGRGSNVTHAGSVALGADSVANGATLGDEAYSPTGDANDVAGIAPVGEVSIGSAGSERRITNLAAGANDTDAVNVSQLKAVAAAAEAGAVHYYSVNDNGVVGGNYDNDGATGINAMAAGVGTTASGVSATAMGHNASAAGPNSVAIGSGAAVVPGPGTGIGVVVIGNQAKVDGPNYGMAIGHNAYATGGTSGASTTTAPVAIGPIARAEAIGSTAVGAGARAGRLDSTVIGSRALAEGRATVAVGVRAQALQVNAIAIGNMAQATQEGSVALGGWAASTVYSGVALGFGSQADREAGMAGYDPVTGKASADTSLTWVASHGAVSVGGQHPLSSQGYVTRQIINVAAGTEDTDAVNVAQLKAVAAAAEGGAVHYYSVNDNGVVGGNYDNDGATGINAMAAGVGTTASGASATAMGHNASAAGANSVAIGSDTTVSNDNNVALGAGSVDRAFEQVSSATIPSVIATLNPDGTVTYSTGADITYSGFAGTATGVVSVGAAGAERQIINVAPGRISADSTDAINGSQLYAVASQVQAIGGQITTIVNNAQTHYYSVNDGGVNGGNYANDGASGTNAMAAGVNATASGENATALGQGSTAAGDNGTAVGNNASSAAADSVAVGSAASVDSGASGGVAIGNGASTTVAGGVAVGEGSVSNIDAGVAGYVPPTADASQADAIAATTSTTGSFAVGNAASNVYRQITGVAAGTADSDAVNVAQLKAVQGTIIDSQTHYYSVNDGGVIQANYDNDGATGANSMAAGVAATASGASAMASGHGASASGVQATAVGHSTQASAANSVAIGSGATASHAGSVALGSGSVTAAAVGTASGVIAGRTYSYAGTTPTSTVSVGDAGSERTITNVAAGRVSATSTDAVNGSQLHATHEAINAVDSRVTHVEVDNARQWNVINQHSQVLNQHGQILNNHEQRITYQEAVGVRYDVREDGSVDYNNVTLQGEGGTQIHNVAPGTAPTDAANMSQLAGVRKDAHAGTAAALAAASMPQAYIPGKSMLAAGAGTYGGETAVSLGVSRLSDNGRWVFKFSGSADTRGRVGVAAGAGFHW